MSWYAVDSVDEAIDASQSLLSPIELGKWLRLALIALFVGVGGGGVSVFFNLVSLPSSLPAEPTPAPTEPSVEALPIEPVVVAAIVGVTVLVTLALGLLSETLRLVFYDALRTGTVRIRGPARRRFGQALRLFGFKLFVGIVFALPFVVVIGVGATLSWAAFSVGEVVLIGVAVFAALGSMLWILANLFIMRVTQEFVTPVMVRTDSGVLAGWGRFWPVLRENLAQFGVYVVVHFLLLLAISIGQSLVGAIVFGIIGTVGALVGFLVVVGVFGGLSGALASTIGLVAVGAVVLLTLLVTAIVFLPIKVVVLTYVFSYELSVLGAADEELRLLPTDDDSETAASTG